MNSQSAVAFLWEPKSRRRPRKLFQNPPNLLKRLGLPEFDTEDRLASVWGWTSAWLPGHVRGVVPNWLCFKNWT